MQTSKFAVGLVAVMVLGACGSSADDDPASADPSAPATDSFSTPFTGAEAYPIFVSSEITVGSNRFLIGLLDGNDAPLGSPGIDVNVSFFDLEGSETEPAFTQSAEFVWIVEEQGRGLYVVYPDFDHEGRWGAEVEISGEGYDETLRSEFDVAEEGSTPAIGDRVPASDTPTADEVGSLKEITTDDDPDPSFYEVSIAEALRRHEPFVAVFATPKFCTSAVCGPTLDDVESVSGDFPKITFIHSEIYEDNDPAQPPVAAVTEWGLPSEPWVFVVDSRGRLVAKFEGSAPPQELIPVLSELR